MEFNRRKTVFAKNDNLMRMTVMAGLLSLAACGGGGAEKTQTPQVSTGLSWVFGQFTDHNSLKNQCAAGSGTALAEKLWLRSYSNDTYLWYNEIPDNDPASFSIADYFDQLKTSARTPSGKLKDQFHFSMSSARWEQLSSSGASVGYGLNVAIAQGAGQERTITVTYIDTGTPADNANIVRGAKIITVDGVNVATANDQASIDTLNNGLFPSNAGQQVVLSVQDIGQTTTREVSLSASTIVSTPVPLTNTRMVGANKVGYMIFNDHIATAQSGLFDAVTELKAENIDELVIDFRYNGGGFLALASQLGYMVAGNQTTNQVFEKTIFNEKHPTINPVTGRTLTPTPFYTQTVNLGGTDIAAGQSLPTLNLPRVFVLTSAGTCSASEAFINGMRGIGVEVIQIGSTTCGKPYGFYPVDNCDTTYFTVQFKGENAKGFGDYADGFSPSETPVFDTDIQGCIVNDDLTKALGDNTEGMLSTALYYVENAQCPVGTLQRSANKSNQYLERADGLLIEDKRARAKFSRNRILMH